MPDNATATHRTRFTGTPTDNAASGFSPAARTRSPNGVRYSTHPTTTIAVMPSQTNGFASDPSAPLADSGAPNPGTLGELDELSNASRRKKRVTPTASRFIAIPTTT